MKKVILASLLLLFCSCDKLINDDFIIVNNCSEKISVTVADFTDTLYVFDVDSKKDTLFLTANGIPRPKTSEMIKTAFKYIVITKNGVSGKRDYVDQVNWSYDMVDEINYKWYLIIETKDFE